MTCLDDNVATEFVAGALPAASVTRVEGHLASCRDCRDLVAALASDAADDHDSDARTHQHERMHASHAGARPQAVYSIGDRVGRYLILTKLGAGGMGVVFAAYDPQLDRKIALKLLRAGINVTTQEARSRLRREAQAIAQLSHPNVVAAYDVGTTDDGDLYVAMEFVEGDTLTTWLKKWPRTWRDILDVFQQAARGLYAAHGVNLLHRDFKPDNVLVGGDGRVRVSDFGLARSLLAGPDEAAARPASYIATLSAELTATGTVLGTPRYMPPEQLVGPDIDARSDQFSFCVALYEALYGVHPLPGGTAVSMLEQGARAGAPPADTRVPAWVHKVVARGLERDRVKRFPTMHQLLGELAPAPVRSRLTVVAIGLAALLIGGLGVAAAVSRGPGLQPPHDDLWALQRLHELEKTVQSLNVDRARLVEQLEKQPEEIAHLRAELEAKNHEIEQLDAQLQALTKQIRPGAVKAALLPKAPWQAQSDQVLLSLEAARQNVHFCFAEWGERPRDAEDGGGHNGDSPAKLAVSLVVCASGSGRQQRAAGVDSPALNGCVADAIARVHFPTGDEDLDVQVLATWSEGQLVMAPRVADHHEARATCDNLE